MSTQNIVEKIAKLLALGKSPNEAEALAAIAKAQKLMSQYSISESDVNNTVKNMGNGFIQQIVTANDGNWQEWEKGLMSAIARSNFCRVIFQYKSNKIEIFGTRYDAEMAVALYALIHPQMKNLATKAFKEARSSINGKQWKVSYYFGMNTKISELLRQVLQLVASETQTGTAIVLKKQDLVKEFYESNKGKTVNTSYKGNLVNGAYLKGYEDGDKLELGIQKPNALLK